MANDGTLDFGGITFQMSIAQFIEKAMPEIISALVNNPQFARQMSQALTPQIQAISLKVARSTNSVASVTPRPGTKTA